MILSKLRNGFTAIKNAEGKKTMIRQNDVFVINLLMAQTINSYFVLLYL